jgi:hypothetical protein
MAGNCRDKNIGGGDKHWLFAHGVSESQHKRQPVVWLGIGVGTKV